MLKNSNAMITIMTVVEHLFMTQFWHTCKSIESNFETFETCSNLELTHLNHRLKLPKRSSSSSWFGWPRWNLPRKMDHPEVTLASVHPDHFRCQRPTRLKLPSTQGGALKNWTAEVSTKRNQTYQVFFWVKQKVFAIWMAVFPHLKPSGTKTSLKNFIN